MWPMQSMRHSRGLVRDGKLLIIGSISDGAWQAQVDPQGGGDGSNLAWRALQGSGLADKHSEPGASRRLKLLVKAIGPLAPDSML